MEKRVLGRTGLNVTTIGFGAFKIGRNRGIKYPADYQLPDENQVARLLDCVLELGINLIDTAPAYGLSEERIGQTLAARRSEFILSTKVGESFENDQARHDFTNSAIRRSAQQSLERLRTDAVDILFIHSDGRDREILNESDAVQTIIELRDAGLTRAIGFSGKTVEGTRAALAWADAVMVEYHLNDQSHAEVISEAHEAGVGVIVKKGLASGHLPAADAIPFVLNNSGVSSLVVGGLNPDHLAQNVAIASKLARSGCAKS